MSIKRIEDVDWDGAKRVLAGYSTAEVIEAMRQAALHLQETDTRTRLKADTIVGMV